MESYHINQARELYNAGLSETDCFLDRPDPPGWMNGDRLIRKRGPESALAWQYSLICGSYPSKKCCKKQAKRVSEIFSAFIVEITVLQQNHGKCYSTKPQAHHLIRWGPSLKQFSQLGNKLIRQLQFAIYRGWPWYLEVPSYIQSMNAEINKHISNLSEMLICANAHHRIIEHGHLKANGKTRPDNDHHYELAMGILAVHELQMGKLRSVEFVDKLRSIECKESSVDSAILHPQRCFYSVIEPPYLDSCPYYDYPCSYHDDIMVFRQLLIKYEALFPSTATHHVNPRCGFEAYWQVNEKELRMHPWQFELGRPIGPNERTGQGTGQVLRQDANPQIFYTHRETPIIHHINFT